RVDAAYSRSPTYDWGNLAGNSSTTAASAGADVDSNAKRHFLLASVLFLAGCWAVEERRSPGSDNGSTKRTYHEISQFIRHFIRVFHERHGGSPVSNSTSNSGGRVRPELAASSSAFKAGRLPSDQQSPCIERLLLLYQADETWRLMTRLRQKMRQDTPQLQTLEEEVTRRCARHGSHPCPSLLSLLLSLFLGERLRRPGSSRKAARRCLLLPQAEHAVLRAGHQRVGLAVPVTAPHSVRMPDSAFAQPYRSRLLLQRQHAQPAAVLANKQVVAAGERADNIVGHPACNTIVSFLAGVIMDSRAAEDRQSIQLNQSVAKFFSFEQRVALLPGQAVQAGCEQAARPAWVESNPGQRVLIGCERDAACLQQLQPRERSPWRHQVCHDQRVQREKAPAAHGLTAVEQSQESNQASLERHEQAFAVGAKRKAPSPAVRCRSRDGH
uniref:TGF_BETA_2 domain-containing protein n=1 Tax=Macrostomum lignano TaxID=282301 RepID=A0A1I8H6S0_9PLAT